MRILNTIYKKILSECPPALPETGIILGIKNGIIVKCEFDKGYECCNGCYSLNTTMIENLIALWNMNGTDFGGIAHSHVPNGRSLSGGDRAYIKQIMECQTEAIGILYFPIVIPHEEMLAFSAVKKSSSVVIRPEPIILTM